MLKKYNYKKLTWIDLQSPDPKELKIIEKDYNIPSHISEELTKPWFRSKIEEYEHYIYLTLHFPSPSTASQNTHNEVKFIIGKDFIITTKYETPEHSDVFDKLFDTHSNLDKSGLGDHAGFIFFFMIKKFYKEMNNELDLISKTFSDVEKNMRNSVERIHIDTLSNIGRRLLECKHSVKTHREVLLSFSMAGAKFFGGEFTHHLNGIIAEYERTAYNIDSTRDMIVEMRATQNALLSTRQIALLTKISMLNVIVLPIVLITLIVAVAMNTISMFDTSFDFLVFLGIIVVISSALLIYFKKKQWLS